MFIRRTVTFAAGALLLALPLAACSLGTIGGVFSPEPSPSEAATSSAPLGESLPRPDMAGRWLLGTDGSPPCGMNFAGPVGGREGTIAPKGGCPGRFFTSRTWAYEQNAMIIRNHAGEMLAQLNVTAPDRLVGQSATGEPVSLTR
jgi:hypothetical protein